MACRSPAHLRAEAAGLGVAIGSYADRLIDAHEHPEQGIRSCLGVLRLAKTYGVTRLELCSPIGFGPEFASLADPKQVRTIMDDYGMKAESGHFMMSELRDTHQESIGWAKEVGITQMITATLGKRGDQPTLDQVKAAADEYNRIAAVSASCRLQRSDEKGGGRGFPGRING